MLLSSLSLVSHLLAKLQKTDVLTGYQEVKNLVNLIVFH